MSDSALELAHGTGVAPEQNAQPYGWVGLVVSIFAIVVVALLLWIAAILLAWAVQIPFDGWQRMWTRFTDAYQSLTAGDAGRCIDLLLVGPVPKTEAIVGYIAVCLLQVFLAAAVLVLARFRGGSRWRGLIGWRPWSLWDNALLFGILLLSAVTLNDAIGATINHFNPEPPETSPPFGTLLILDILVNVVLAAIFEELIIRGWLYTGIRAKLGAWPTILITTILFSLLHLMDSVPDVLATLPLGAAAGYLRERTGSVKATIAFHLSHNALAVASALL